MADKMSPAEQQARNELDNAQAYGNRDAEQAARKRLDALGVKVDKAAQARGAVAETDEDEGRARKSKADGDTKAESGKKPAAEAEAEDKGRRTPPQGRATPTKAQTRA